MNVENMYRVLVATVFVLLMVVGIYIGVEVTDDKQKTKQQVVVSNTDEIEIYDEEEEKLVDVAIKYTDIYPDCGHNIENNETQQETTIAMVKKEIEDKDLGYRLIGERDGVLLYQKVHNGKCMNHYKVILENDVVAIYRMNESGQFAPYQTTQITISMLREGIKEQLEQGIEVDDVEELFLLMEDIES